MEAGRRPRARGSRRHAGDRRQGRRRASGSSPGTTATTPRRCARRSTTSTRTRSSRTCSSRSCARGCSGSPGRLFGLQFSPVSGVPVAQPDVRVFEVKDRAGKHVGLWYFDPYARAGKRSGAWMNEYRDAGEVRRRGPDHRLEQRELREARARRARARELGRRHDAVPRVRPRAARAVLERAVPLARRHERGPRLRRVPLAAPRALARDAGGPQHVRRALQDRPADPDGAGREDPARVEVQPGIRDRRVPGGGARRHEAAPRRRRRRSTPPPSSATRSRRSGCRGRS